MNPCSDLSCHNLAFERDDIPVFEGVSFDVSAGQVLQVSGANGAGKTTLIRILATILTPSAGDLFWKGNSVNTCQIEFLSNLIYLGHQAGVKQALTPCENLRWLSKIHLATDTVVAEALQLVGLEGYEDVPCHTLSAGQQRRVALARLYMTQARLWILDEPFTAIDKTGIVNLELLMSKHLQEGGLIVISSHQQLSLADVHSLELEAYAASV